jgi:hypothetical protein
VVFFIGEAEDLLEGARGEDGALDLAEDLGDGGSARGLDDGDVAALEIEELCVVVDGEEAAFEADLDDVIEAFFASKGLSCAGEAGCSGALGFVHHADTSAIWRRRSSMRRRGST